MESGYETSFPAGSSYPPITTAVQDDSMYSTLSLYSLLSMAPDRVPELGMRPFDAYVPGSFTFYGEHVPATNQKQVSHSSSTGYLQLGSMKVPKSEPVELNESPYEATQSLCFFPKPSATPSSSFHQLPDLHSLEQQSYESPVEKRARLDSMTANQLSFQLTNYLTHSNQKTESPTIPPVKRPVPKSQRVKVSDKTRSLQKLMPWERRMDIAAMLEEAYKYIKFLQAQVSVLQSMPSRTTLIPVAGAESSFYGDGSDGDVCGMLGTLSRQQLLYVLLNSPMAQNKLYSEGCCVYSLEQLILLRKVDENRALLQQQQQHLQMQQMMFGPSNFS